MKKLLLPFFVFIICLNTYSQIENDAIPQTIEPTEVHEIQALLDSIKLTKKTKENTQPKIKKDSTPTSKKTTEVVPNQIISESISITEQDENTSENKIISDSISPVNITAKTSQSEVKPDSVPFIKPIKTTQWAYKKTAGLLLSETAFVNWNAGGENSVAGIIKFDFEFNYVKDRLFWNNLLRTRFGLNQEKGQGVRKTDDVLEFTSNFGYRKTEVSNWYNSARFNFRTQFAPGYKYPNRETSISGFFSPAYIFLGIGSQYTSPSKKFKMYLSPLTNKTTLVMNQRLANNGSFGVKKAEYDENGVLITEGENSKIELGVLMTGEWENKLMENIVMNNKLVLYSDFLNSFLNVDFDWEMRLQLIVNKYVKANIMTHILYDDDVKDKDTGAPKIQFKQLLGVGVVYTF